MYLRKLSKRRTFESYLFHLVSVPSLKMVGGTHFWLVWSVPSKAKKSVPSNGINRVGGCVYRGGIGIPVLPSRIEFLEIL